MQQNDDMMSDAIVDPPLHERTVDMQKRNVLLTTGTKHIRTDHEG